MAFSREKLREIVLQMLYSEDFAEMELSQLQSFIMDEFKITKPLMDEAILRLTAIESQKNVIDAAIKEVSSSYNFERISKVELNILRQGAYELLFDEEKIPPKVAIAEAIRLCRKYGTRDSANFINAILDGIYSKVQKAK